MSFARNFALGQQIAKTALDTYEDAKQKRQLGEVMNAKPETGMGYTADDGAQLEAAAQSGQYDIGIKYKDDGTFDSYSVTPKADPTQTANLGLQRVTDFAGKRYSGELSPDQIDTMRYRAAADVIGQTDPIAGLRMRREIKQDAREDERIGWERDDRPIKQRMNELQLSGYERQERAGIRDDEWQTKSLEFNKAWDDLGPEGQSKFLRDASYNPNVKGHVVMGKDGGAKVLSDSGQVYGLSPAEVRQMFVLERLMSVDPVRATKELSASSEKLRAIAKDVFDMDLKTQEIGLKKRLTDAQVGYYGRKSEADNPLEAKLGALRKALGRNLTQEEILRAGGLTKGSAMEVNSDGTVVSNGQLYVPDPTKPGQYRPAQGLGPSGVDVALDRFLQNRGPATASAPTNHFTPLPKTDITRVDNNAYGNPDNFERRSQRGLFGGVGYEYYDPATGKTLSVSEYNRLLGGN